MIITHDEGNFCQDDYDSSSKTLSKSLTQISEAYERSKERLNRDLNKMEYHVRKIKDTRDRLTMKHIKSLDLVEKEVNRVMPCDI